MIILSSSTRSCVLSFNVCLDDDIHSLTHSPPQQQQQQHQQPQRYQHPVVKYATPLAATHYRRCQHAIYLITATSGIAPCQFDLRPPFAPKSSTWKPALHRPHESWIQLSASPRLIISYYTILHRGSARFGAFLRPFSCPRLLSCFSLRRYSRVHKLKWHMFLITCPGAVLLTPLAEATRPIVDRPTTT